jgi:hypothetical protein
MVSYAAAIAAMGAAASARWTVFVSEKMKNIPTIKM